MEDDEEIESHHSPVPNGKIAVTVAAAPPSSNCLTLALPIQNQKTPGREDCWSEGATAILIEAWGERYLELSRGNLKQKHWKDVADIVSSREDYAKNPKTDIQCKNRIDTVKKKYKVEKAKIASGGGPSKWRFFDKLDELIGLTSKTSSSNSTYQRVPMGIPTSRKRAALEWDDESNSGDSSDGLPPERQRMVNKRSEVGKSMSDLTGAILKLGEAYEQAEMAKLQQLVEMEKQRMKFAKELELQRMEYFMKTQLELKNRRRHHGNNNSDCSN